MTLAEAAPLLDPPVSAEQLMRLINQLPGFRSVGVRSDGRPGPPSKLYDLDEVMDLHRAVAPWLPIPRVTSRSLSERMDRRG